MRLRVTERSARTPPSSNGVRNGGDWLFLRRAAIYRRVPLRMVTMEMTLQISQACTSVQFLNRRSSEECCDR